MDKLTHHQELLLVVQLLTVVIMATVLLETLPGPVRVMENGVDQFHFVMVCYRSKLTL